MMDNDAGYLININSSSIWRLASSIWLGIHMLSVQITICRSHYNSCEIDKWSSWRGPSAAVEAMEPGSYHSFNLIANKGSYDDLW